MDRAGSRTSKLAERSEFNAIAVAIEMGCSARDLSETIHPHPTLGETVAFSAENYFGLATEIYRPRADAAAR